jgi:hypothetical protein
MAEFHKFDNERARAANSEADILGKLDYWRAALHERGLHTEAMVMGCAASTIRILRGQVREKIPKRGDLIFHFFCRVARLLSALYRVSKTSLGI